MKTTRLNSLRQHDPHNTMKSFQPFPSCQSLWEITRLFHVRPNLLGCSTHLLRATWTWAATAAAGTKTWAIPRRHPNPACRCSRSRPCWAAGCDAASRLAGCGGSRSLLPANGHRTRPVQHGSPRPAGPLQTSQTQSTREAESIQWTQIHKRQLTSFWLFSSYLRRSTNKTKTGFIPQMAH